MCRWSRFPAWIVHITPKPRRYFPYFKGANVATTYVSRWEDISYLTDFVDVGYLFWREICTQRSTHGRALCCRMIACRMSMSLPHAKWAGKSRWLYLRSRLSYALILYVLLKCNYSCSEFFYTERKLFSKYIYSSYGNQKIHIMIVSMPNVTQHQKHVNL